MFYVITVTVTHHVCAILLTINQNDKVLENLNDNITGSRNPSLRMGKATHV